MENNFNATLLKWAAILMLSGGVLFWIGAFTPPWRQWMTSDTKEYLAIIHDNQLGWFLIHSPMVVGVILTVFSLQLLSSATPFSGTGKLFSDIGANAFFFGSILLVLNFAFRLTVTLWVADQFAKTNEVQPWFNTWFDWSNLIFAIHCVLAYAAVGFMGLALRYLSVLPSWTTWFCIIYGFAGSIGFIVRFPLFVAPLMIHLPFMICGVALLIKLKTR